MRLFRLEHSAGEYRADLMVHGTAVVLLTASLVAAAPAQPWPRSLIFVVLGLLAWSLMEYAVHRFVLHGMAPFRHWHARHHQRPTALIYTPTLLSATAIATLVFLPLWLLCSWQRACALTLGMSTGYLAYTITHHAIHHGSTRSPWLQQRQRWHALHHRRIDHPGRYGVTSAFWDYIFRTTGQPAQARRTGDLRRTFAR